jgi:DNA-binding response OmpR family regulator
MSSREGLSILVLDDDAPFLESFQDFLSQDGHRVFPATSGKDAVEISRKVSIDLSILDYDLPDLDGIETLVLIQRHRPAAPAIFVSGNPSTDLERTVMEVGAFALIRKPFQTEELRLVIREATFGQNRF